MNIVAPYPVSNDILPYYYNACDILVFPSFSEGSPNVIKEAMACNLPIVATDVGDIRLLFGNTKGCLLTSFDIQDIAANIEKLIHTGSSGGRKRIIELGLDSESIARKIISVYNETLNK